MSVHCAAISLLSLSLKASICSINETANKRKFQTRFNSGAPSKLSAEFLSHDSPEPTNKPCFCGRRHFIEATTLGTTLFPVQPSVATGPYSDYTALLKKFHPPRPDWYEEFYAGVMNSATESYEAEVATYKSQIFSNLKGKGLRILEIGIGTGPNLSYYASGSDVEVVGIDPNPKMEKYARSSASSAGLPPSNFEFIQAVGEAIPLSDASVDAVVGTLVLCSVKDVDMTLKDGTFLKFIQRVLDPLQRTLADGCHLSRETGNNISRAGFSDVELNMAFLSSATFINPHAYGVAYK
ncbi:hypothetical protein LR48_Vigan06g108200 [Vigna angularis]|uniref:Methyltransferase type 11 domain-containing protein n=1 Tax=Phaseolus angularis TaxID=3914 RepID=A0A0L9USS8_PHAAN|nr:hypothetical protein LR48_Vigan06g108200 [Vigna angularis]